MVAPSVVLNGNILQDRYLMVRGVKLRYRASGNGDPVLLLHGVGASLEQWEWSQPGLSTRHQVVALDLPGFGRSQSPQKDQFDLDHVVELLGAFIDEMGWRSATVIGNSMGGMLAIAMALNLEGRVNRLVLAGSAGVGPDLGFSLRLVSLPCVGEAILPFMGFRPLVHLCHKRLFSDPSRLPARLVDVATYYYKRHSIRSNFLRAIRLGVSPRGQRDSINFNGQLDKINVPTLLIWGRGDSVIPLEHGKTAHKLIPGSRLTIIDDCGHVPQIEHPDRFVDEVERFTASTRV